MKCANCSSDALFEYQITKKKSIFYCGKDLPRFLEPQRKAGHLKITASMKIAEESMLEKLSTPEPIFEEAEVVVEEPVKPTPVKKAAKKSEKE